MNETGNIYQIERKDGVMTWVIASSLKVAVAAWFNDEPQEGDDELPESAVLLANGEDGEVLEADE